MVMVIKNKIRFDELAEIVSNSIQKQKENAVMIDDSKADDILRKMKVIYERHEEKTIDQLDKLQLELKNEIISEMDEVNSGWTFVASAVMARIYYSLIEFNNKEVLNLKNEHTPFEWVQKMTEKGFMNDEILKMYSEEEINQAYQSIDQSKDELFTSTGLHTLASRYCNAGFNKELLEYPQYRWMTIALTLQQKEDKKHRMELVQESYWALSNLLMTVATPTLANAGKKGSQMSSCFIDTVDDSLQSIYDSNTDIANLSKFGGGIGVYMGKVRARGSDIRGYAGSSSGILPWIKQINNTAVSVDQLGQRQGAVAVYLDIWHKDIMSFLDLKLNNGDERLRAHDIFTAVTLPDIFMEAVQERKSWFLFDPHEVRKKKGWSIEDFYDEELGKGSFRDKYLELVEDDSISKDEVQAIDIMKRILVSQLETGTPFMFYRDQVNRLNPNKHAGMIYSSNLCTEIAQNMSPSQMIQKKLSKVDASELFGEVQEYLGEEVIITINKPGDLVVCNLSSINLGKARSKEVLDRLIKIQVRMLDNVIDINNLPLIQAQRTNQKYRAVGLGTFGWHHALALEGIHWESEEAVEYADKLYEYIAYLTIKASSDLAKEKGSYPLYEGSDWETGSYFTNKNYFDAEETDMSEEWKELAQQVKDVGIRNGYLMAIAPNSSTSIIAGSTASIDPVFDRFFYEEKKNFRLPTIAPDLNPETYELYQRAYVLDQRWSVRQAAARQKHIDQAMSFNFYVPNTIKASVLLDLHLQAWREGLKTTYYVRSTASDIKECEWCHS